MPVALRTSKAICLLATLTTLTTVPVPTNAASPLTTRPNIVFVITDDQGYGDVSFHGNPILRTPEIDRFAQESVRLSDYHVSPTCTPTRASLMTGRDTNRTGAWHTVMGCSLLREGETAWGEVFGAGGYRTGMFGKWHLGANYPFRPEDHGFDEVVRLGGGGIGQTPDFWDNAYFDDTFMHNGRPKKYSGYCTDVFFAEAIRFMDESAAAGRPFVAYIATNTPHSPLRVPERYWQPYADKGIGRNEALFFGMIANIDENFGRLRRWLAERGLEENTILVFTTDNGTATGERVFNAGMRGKKASEYEGGHRVPFFIRWPAGLLAHGSEVSRLTAHIDVLPSLLELCGVGALERSPPMDGRSFASLLKRPDGAWPDRVVIVDSQRVPEPIKWKQSSVMSGPWRLINGRELYDISTDPGQERDLAPVQPDRVQRMRAAYETWWQGLQPVFARDTRIVLGHPRGNPAVLNAMDWKGTGTLPPTTHGVIRKGRLLNGHWQVRFEVSGEYEFELRRWPPEVDVPMNAGLPPPPSVPELQLIRDEPGMALPVVRARLRINDGTWEAEVLPGATSARFSVQMPVMEASITATLVLENGEECGAYYVVVDRRDWN